MPVTDPIRTQGLRRGSFAVAAVLVAGLHSVPAEAQDRAFESLEVSIGPTVNLPGAAIHDVWDAGTGGSLRIVSPFHTGYLAAGGRLIPFRPRGEVPGFDAALVYGTWGLQTSPDGRIAARMGVRVGNLRMAFDDNSEPGVRTESELTVGVEASLGVRLSPALHLTAEWSSERTFTRRAMGLHYASAGLAYRFGTPEWIKRLLL